MLLKKKKCRFAENKYWLRRGMKIVLLGKFIKVILIKQTF